MEAEYFTLTEHLILGDKANPTMPPRSGWSKQDCTVRALSQKHRVGVLLQDLGFFFLFYFGSCMKGSIGVRKRVYWVHIRIPCKHVIRVLYGGVRSPEAAVAGQRCITIIHAYTMYTFEYDTVSSSQVL